MPHVTNIPRHLPQTEETLRDATDSDLVEVYYLCSSLVEFRPKSCLGCYAQELINERITQTLQGGKVEKSNKKNYRLV